ncbi:MAG: cyclic nucleotide-binding domain-containing protein [Planctomycetota bacterium]|nr:cyclic nucleotide-binding domain-containing protein [Planctomycetota bacterium]
MTTARTLRHGSIREKVVTEEELINLIDDTKWASDFSREEVDSIAKYVTAYEAPSGVYLVREGKREAYLCLILEGRAQIVKEKSFESRESTELTFASSGQAIGEISLLDNQPRSASVITTKKTFFLVMDQSDFEEMTTDVPRLAIKFLRKIASLLCQRLRQTSGKLVQDLDIPGK